MEVRKRNAMAQPEAAGPPALGYPTVPRVTPTHILCTHSTFGYTTLCVTCGITWLLLSADCCCSSSVAHWRLENFFVFTVVLLFSLALRIAQRAREE